MLFRQQAIDEKRATGLGTIYLDISLSQRILVIAFAFVCCLLCSFLYFAEYTRREQASGILLPTAGLIEITAEAPGTVTHVHGAQGENITGGAPLISISSEKISSGVGATTDEVIAQLRSQKEKLASDIFNLNILKEKQETSLKNHIDLLKLQLNSANGQLDLLRRQVDMNLKMLDKIRPLEIKGYISALQIQQQESGLLDQQVQLTTASRAQLDIQQQLRSQQEQLDQLPLTMQTQRHDLERKVSDIDQTLAQNELQRSSELTSPVSGVVASSLAIVGQPVTAGQILMVIAPTGSPLKARLLLPTKSIGFIKAGDKVVLRYQAFPYQKFGLHTGRVIDVARSPLLPAQASTLIGQQLQEPMYTVDADIDEQEIEAYGGKQKLKPGMQIDADILLDRRTLFEWVFDPLYSAGKHLTERGDR